MYTEEERKMLREALFRLRKYYTENLESDYWPQTKMLRDDEYKNYKDGGFSEDDA